MERYLKRKKNVLDKRIAVIAEFGVGEIWKIVNVGPDLPVVMEPFFLGQQHKADS